HVHADPAPGVLPRQGLAAAVRRRGGRALMSSQRPSGWYAVPAFAFFALFAALPMVIVVYLSFTAWDGLGTPAPNGVDNWTRLVQDGEATASVGRTVLLMVVSWLVQTPNALLVGVWAAEAAIAGGPQLDLLPALLLSTAAIALLWRCCSTRTSARSSAGRSSWATRTSRSTRWCS
ncbi:hypothetical protein K7G98_21520, partial [Saccharothrix sp. MB29]|nr:hypothetical protein [Saccharothrix sp. MB29]